MALNLKSGEAANLLSLDGGGIKGISTVVILQTIMDKVREIEDGGKSQNKSPDRLPVDYFHLAAGTSTGGIIALMLFRLRMSPAQVKLAYNEMARKIFAKKKTFRTGGRFPDGPLIEAIDDIVEKRGPSDIDKKNKGGTSLVNNEAKM
jgi:patatin-like phospholipase/acyl hydrolase